MYYYNLNIFPNLEQMNIAMLCTSHASYANSKPCCHFYKLCQTPQIFLPLFVVVVSLFMNLPNSVTCHVKFLAESSNSDIKVFFVVEWICSSGPI